MRRLGFWEQVSVGADWTSDTPLPDLGDFINAVEAADAAHKARGRSRRPPPRQEGPN